MKRTIELRVLEDRVIRVVFVPEMKAAKKRIQKIANDELRALSLSPSIVRFSNEGRYDGREV